ncbi:MAG: S8 family serine peptidase [Rhizobiaceae bacterium]|nr:S8 family serine peptidase [Rhizobiaceae bacterium]MCV0404725.1 S8 family serine peptidase [Rhizobiaceae bacterium]
MKKRCASSIRMAFKAAVLLLAGLAVLPGPGTEPYLFATPALADDGDDGGGDDGDDGGGGGYSGGGGSAPPSVGGRPPRILRQLFRPFRGAFRPSRPRRAAPAVQIPPMAEREIIALGLSGDNLAMLQTRGYELLEEIALPVLDGTVVKLEIPAATSLEAARDEIRSLNATAQVDFNHYYQPSQDADGGSDCEGRGCWPRELIGWPTDQARSANGCRSPVRIGMIDTGINPDHEVFSGTALEVKRIGDEEDPQSGRQHGTAVAALLVGASSSRTPGLLGEAGLFAVDAFFRAGRDSDRAEAFHLIVAIDHLLSQQVSVINMSLAGEANDVLRRAIGQAVADHNTVLVAAVGNEGPRAKPVYPAAYPGVLAVTAVDRRQRVYRRAVQGEHVDIAAPGVEIWTAASIRGARPKTGTSFAAPYVTAAVALMKATDPEIRLDDIKRKLFAAAADIGEPGRDNVFGWGLMNASEICGVFASPASITTE